MTVAYPKKTIRFWSRLRTRMTVSYVLFTLVMVLLLESLALALVIYVFTRSPVAGYWALQRAGSAAQVYAFQAAVQADGNRLIDSTTFKPGQKQTLALHRENDPPNLSWFELELPYVAPGSAVPERPTFALVVNQNGQGSIDVIFVYY